ncbi:MAG: hypothetical protein LBC51_10605 [Treponema sp.]|jgi:ABC-type glycerol-3-phosphate transport system substrate-binding protein|nr:hypothetical protein [Treponema sp.]
MKKKTVLLVSLVLAVLLLGSCATAPESGSAGSSSAGSSSAAQPGNVYPREITDWIAQNGDKAIIGVGTSDLERTSDALRQARTLALQDLAANVQSEVVSITKDFVSDQEARGQKERVAEFNEGIGIKVQQTIEGAQSLGPYKMNNETWVARYIMKEPLQETIRDVIKETFQETDDQINKMLGL